VTDEDRKIFQEMLNAALQAQDERLTSRLDAALGALKQELLARQDLSINLSDVRTELIDRLDRVDRRTERTELNTNAILMEVAGMSKSLTMAEQLDSATAGQIAGIRRTIEDLARRVAELEKKAS
jgi:hypothetical protein